MGEAVTERRQQLQETLRAWEQDAVLHRLQENEALWTQLLRFESWYPGGIDGYLSTATELLTQLQQAVQPAELKSKEETAKESSPDPFASWVPSIPHDPHGLLTLETPLYHELEAIGLEHAAHSAFVVVAGGLGERLGYHDIKLSLPVETLTRTSYLEADIQHILALESEVSRRKGVPRDKVRIPLAIMTSDATHVATEKFLEHHGWFGMRPGQVTLIKQDTVPCIDAVEVEHDGVKKSALRLVVNDATGELVMKPHGHGDVHTLLRGSGIAERWLKQDNIRYVHFIQDTNLPILNSTLPLLGAAVQNKWTWTFTAVPRKAKDASGAIVKFSDPLDPNHSSLFNVEYNELDDFLRTKAGGAFPDGDANDPATGYSPFPGNINHFVAELSTYLAVLDHSHGKTPEIFNPKFADAQRRTFKSPARLECMMQDFPKLITTFNQATATASSSSVGLVTFPATFVYSPCKNDIVSAAAKADQDIPPQCASSAEHDLYALNKTKLAHVGVHFDSESTSGVTGAQTKWRGVPVSCATGPLIAFTPSFGVSVDSLKHRFPQPASVAISNRSALIIQAENVTIYALKLDGALRIVACAGATVEIKGLSVTNQGVAYEELPTEGEISPVDAMRGYVLTKREVKELCFDQPGYYVVNENGDVA
ncbi:hypothetical protein Poli38472_008353 [Pythium oligandrum]|uniref:UTP-monosaccharide-1-phosphate uridylyltransferase n=1 Tax=Pythium oligandrum TaxID=41045 RepID=A0A8K1CN73_PYTOL|nr:hypothetical protein Poli38472_008353 [Pythium oligandrum]|eukprot:TMW65711.1 hypothetical protein Poli38472_008353 [Pythium oligandrum]